MDQLETLRFLLGSSADDYEDEDLQVFLDRAEGAIMDKRYPFVDWTETDDDDNRVYPLESRYYALQVEIAVALFNRIGAEGEAQHTENGVYRTYQTGGDIPDALLNRVVPKAKVL